MMEKAKLVILILEKRLNLGIFIDFPGGYAIAEKRETCI